MCSVEWLELAYTKIIKLKNKLINKKPSDIRLHEVR